MRTKPIVVVSALAVALSLLLVAKPRAKKPKPVPCAGRWVVTQGAEAIVADSTPSVAVVSVQGKQVSIGTHCGPVNGTVKALKKGTNVAAGFKGCGSSLQKVKLKASIASDCSAMSGVVKAKKVKPQHFRASLSR